MKVRATLFFFFLCISCRNFQQDKNVMQPGSGLWIQLTLVVNKEDRFQLMYQIKGNEQWISNGDLIKYVEGNNRAQKILFNLPEDIRVSRIRIDLGENQHQEILDLYKLTFFRNGKNLALRRENIFKHFVFNKYVSRNNDGKNVDLAIQDGQYDPLMVSSDYFMDQLNKILYLQNE